MASCPFWISILASAHVLLLSRQVVCVQSSASVSLQNPEGQHLDFLRLQMDAAFFGPFLFVEHEMVFQNPEYRRMEGRFSFALPSSTSGPAMPSRFAMEIQGKLMEGEVVDRSKAKRIYREILHEARDPALLEQGQGNIFTARVFPIEPRAMVRLILSYAISVPLRSMRRSIALPLSGLPQVNEFAFSLIVGSLGTSDFDATCSLPGLGLVNGTSDATTGRVHFIAPTQAFLTPDADAVLEVQLSESAVSANPATAISVDDGQLVTLFTAQQVPQQQITQAPANWVIYIDTSASTADSFVVRVPLIAALLDAMPQTTVQVFAFDIEVVELRARGAKDAALGSAVRQALDDRFPLGATNFSLLLNHVNGVTSGDGSTIGVLILTDAIPTGSVLAAAQLGALLEDRPDRVVQIGVIGSKFDSTVAAAIAAAGHGRIVQIPLTSKDVSSVANAAWADVLRPLGQVGTTETASGWVWPQSVFDIHAGDEVIVFSGGETDALFMETPQLQLGSGSAAQNLTAGTSQAAAAAFGALLSREATKAKLALLESRLQLAQNAAAAASLKETIVKLSEQNRVMSSHTALLVLETEEDYRRFEIARDQLSPILVVTDGGVKLISRDEFVLQALPTTTTQITTSSTTSTSTTATTTQDSSTETLLRDEIHEEDCTTIDCLLDELEETRDDLMEVSGAPVSTGGSEAFYDVASFTRSACRPSFLCMLVILASLLLGFGEWANLEADAAAILEKKSANSTGRYRDESAAYAGALWTKRRAAELRRFSMQWITWDPSNGLAYEYLGRAAQYLGDARTALRATTSVAEIAPRDSEQLLRGTWMALTLDIPEAADWARHFAKRSLDERADNPNTYRAFALAAWKQGDILAAADAYQTAQRTAFHSRYGEIGRVFAEEADLFYQSLTPAEQATLKGMDNFPPQTQGNERISLRVTLSWLTDANDVDLHVKGPSGDECYYGNPSTPAGLQLYSDQTQGLGPEVIVMNGRMPGIYRIGVKYFSSGSMGASRGTIVIWKLLDGKPQGQSQIEVFTLPAGYNEVLPVATVEIK